MGTTRQWGLGAECWGIIMSSKSEWSNDEKIDVRTKIALKVLFVMFKVLSPYRFGSQFEKDIETIKKDLDAL